MTGRLRAAREADVPALIELARRSWLGAFAQVVPFERIEHWVRTDRTGRWYRAHWPEMTVLEEDGVIRGLVQPRGDEIDGLWVPPRFQGRGVGTALLRAGEEIIRHAGHAVVWLTCDAENAPALRFYVRRGYVETARLRAPHPAGGEYEDIRLERRLDP